MIQGFFDRSKGYAGGNTSPCTNFTERDVVFGGIDKLRDIIRNSYDVLDSELQVVLTGCTSGIVGDDVESLVSEFQSEGKPIISVETAGFKCTNYEAHSLLVNAIVDQYVAKYEEDNEARSEENTVNVFASLPYQDPFWKGNLREYNRLLTGLGLNAQILFGPESGGAKEWQRIPRANFNVFISPWYGQPIVEHLKSKYGQPYTHFPYIPIGANETEKFLRKTVAFALENGAEIDEIKANRFIQKEVDDYYEEIDSLATFVLDFRYGLPSHVHILHDAGYVLGLSRFLLNEVGIVPKEQFITDNTPEKYKEKIREELKGASDKREIPLFFESDAGKAQDMLRKIKHSRRGVIIGSGWEKELASEKGYDFVSAGLPSPYRLVLTTNYAGFSGGLRVIEDIYNTTLATYK
jgi:nitrogenase molybdenum-iron protein beta chain